MTVRQLIAELIMMPQDAEVFVDCSVDYPECARVSVCRQWKEMPERFKETHPYGFSMPRDEDVFLE